jgi:hypothetical protein
MVVLAVTAVAVVASFVAGKVYGAKVEAKAVAELLVLKTDEATIVAKLKARYEAVLKSL